MHANQATDHRHLLGHRVSIPETIVYREFVAETVVLNLSTGTYHGLNAVGGRMLEVLSKVPRVGDAAEQLAAEYDQPLEEVQRDICAFCEDLAQRGLINLEGPGAEV
jgi:hypothetical protein